MCALCLWVSDTRQFGRSVAKRLLLTGAAPWQALRSDVVSSRPVSCAITSGVRNGEHA